MDQLNKIQADIEELKIIAAKNAVVLERNTEDIRKHIRRTDLLEDQVQIALLPIKFAKWSAAVVGVGASLASLVYTVCRLFGLLE
jgi:hypothetical protein